MEFMAEEVLPLYIEEDEEEAAAAKQKRRQESRKPPPPPPTPEEEAKKERYLAMITKLHEFDPMLGHGYYTRIWFVDFDTFDIDEETQFGPMRFADSLIRDNHELTDSLNVLRLEIMHSDAGFPINVYGTVIVRDRLDMKCMYIFRRGRDNCQLVQAKGESLILTGPSRGIVFHSDAYFEINLKIKKDTEIRDEQFCKALTDIDVGKFERNNFIKRRTVVSWLSEVDLVLAYVRKALEGTIEIKILSGPEAFFGKLTACTSDVSTPIILYDSDLDDRNTLGNERVIQLLRRVVAVSADRMLIIHAYASGGGHTGSCDFTPLIKGPDKTQITCGAYKLQVKVIWSTLLDE